MPYLTGQPAGPPRSCGLESWVSRPREQGGHGVTPLWPGHCWSVPALPSLSGPSAQGREWPGGREAITGWCPPGFPAHCSGLASQPWLPTPSGSRAHRPCPQALQEASPLCCLLLAPLAGSSQLLEGRACVSLGTGLAHRREKDGGRQAPVASPMCAPRSLWACVHLWPSWTHYRWGRPEAHLMEEAELLREGECLGSPAGAQGAPWVSRGHGEHPGSPTGARGAPWVSRGHGERPGSPAVVGGALGLMRTQARALGLPVSSVPRSALSNDPDPSPNSRLSTVGLL